MYDIHTELLKDGYESVICYGRGAKTQDSGVYKTCGELYSKFNNLLSRFTGLMYGGCFFSTNKLISVIKKEKPDIVHLHCINGYCVNIYRLIAWLKKNKIKTVLTLHAEFMHTGSCGYALDCERWKSGCGSCPRLKKETKSIFLDRTALSWKKMRKAFNSFNENLNCSMLFSPRQPVDWKCDQGNGCCYIIQHMIIGCSFNRSKDCRCDSYTEI